MTEWQKIIDDGYTVPEGRALPGLVAELSEALRSPDPVVRDAHGYGVLATWIDRGVLGADRLTELGDAMAARFADSEIQARTFAPLILDVIVSKGVFEARWVDAFAAWYAAEEDLRGLDPKLGWLHAVAHGADLLGALGRRPEVAPADMLALAARRMTAPTEHVWDAMEDDRLAHAMALTLTRTDVADATGWLPEVAALFRDRDRARIAPNVTNTLRTLRVLYLFADRGVRPGSRESAVALPHRDALREAIAETAALVAPFAG